jgi:DNA-binding LacI/PurR family transcriptional regulator
MPLTQHEIVEQLGISRGTLHRILNGSPLVKASTRERILKELDRLNYVPNAIARGLKTQRTNTIGIIGPAALKQANIDKLNAVHLAARELGYTVMLGYSDGSAEQDAMCIRELQSRMVDGFIAMGRGLPESVPHYQGVIKAGVPLVTLYPIEGLEADCVYVDTRKAYADLTRHLISLGHERIGLLLDPVPSQFSLNREYGFRDAMKAAGLEIRPEWIIYVAPDGTPGSRGNVTSSAHWQISDYQYGFWGASLMLAKRQQPTAVVCFSDEFAIGALRAADVAGVRIPEDLAIVGYDDKEPARFARVPLTTMHQPDEQIGKEAISLLLDRINGKIEDPAPVVRPLSATLVVRDSCGSKLPRK